MIAKLNAYGADRESLRFLCFYFKNRKQRTKVNTSYSRFNEIIYGVSKGPILGPLPFNIYIFDSTYESRDFDIASYANDNTPYTCSQELNILKTLKKEIKNYLIGFKIIISNQRSASDGCYLV